MKFSILLLAITWSFFACASSSAGIATSNVPIIDKKYTVIGPVEQSKRWVTIDLAILGFPLTKPPVDEVVSDAIRSKEADALINIRYYTDKMIFLFITVNRFGLNAEAVKWDASQPTVEPTPEVIPSKKKK